MNLEFTYDIPDSPGYYYWTNFGEHTPTILKVERHGDSFYAYNEEYSFTVQPLDMKKVMENVEKYQFEPIDGHYHGEEMWAKIPEVTLDGQVIKPNSY